MQYSRVENRAPAFKYYQRKKIEKTEKDIVGPGYLKDLEDSFKKNALRKKTPDPVFGKSKINSVFQQYAQAKKYVPGVGAYKDSERAFKNHMIFKKERVPFISNSKFLRFTETTTKEKQWVPGPGSYNIIPFAKKI